MQKLASSGLAAEWSGPERVRCIRGMWDSRKKRHMSLAKGDRILSGLRFSHSSDRSLEALLRKELQNSPYATIRAVSCRMKDGVLTLNGSVTSYYFKQVAQRLAMGVLKDSAIVVNDLQVEP